MLLDTTNKKGSSLFNSRVLLFLISQNLSLFGSSVVGFAIIWHITLETSSGTWLMLGTLTTMIPQVLVSLWGGVWADRYNRKHLIMLSDTFVALATLVLALFYIAGFREIWLLLAISAVRALGSGVQSPAVNAIYPQLVPPEGLTRVQAVNQSLSSALMLLAPAAGGLLLGWLDISWAFFVDVITASLAVGILAFIKIEKNPGIKVNNTVFKDLKEGFSYTFSHPLLKRIVLCYGFSFFLMTPAIILTPLQVGRSFGGDVWRLTVNEMVWTIGSLVGGILISLHGDFKDKVRMIALSLGAFGILFALLGLAPNFVLYLCIMGTAGLFLPLLITSETVFVQEQTREDMLGRVFSILQIVSVSAMPIGIMLFGPLADAVSVESILILTGILLVLVAVWYERSSKRVEFPIDKNRVA